jgi:hypothetical protein
MFKYVRNICDVYISTCYVMISCFLCYKNKTKRTETPITQAANMPRTKIHIADLPLSVSPINAVEPPFLDLSEPAPSPSACPSPVFQRSVQNYDESCNPASFEPLQFSPLTGVKRSLSPCCRISRRCEMSPMSPLSTEPTTVPSVEEQMPIPLAELITRAGLVRAREEEEEESVPRLVRSCGEKWA